MITAFTAASTSASSQTMTGSEPPSSSVTRLSAGAAMRGDVAPGRGLAGEGDAAHVGVADEHVADLRAAAGDDVQHAVGHARLGEQARDLERRQRRRRGRLGHDRVARGQRRRDLRAQQGQREVVGRDRRTDAHRAADDHPVGGAEGRRQLLMGAAHLRRGLGVVAHAVREVRDLAARLGDRLALLGGQQRRQVGGVLLDQRRGLGKDVRALLDVGRRPLGERAPGGGDGQLDVGGGGARHAADDLLGGRVDDVDLLAGGGLSPLPADEHRGFHGQLPSITAAR